MSNNEFTIDSNTVPGKQYFVYLSLKKGWLCECEHFWRKHTECSHIRMVKQLKREHAYKEGLTREWKVE